MRSAIQALSIGLVIILMISQIIAQSIQTCTLRATQNVNRRVAPGTQFKISGVLDANQPVTATLQFTDPDGFIWWQLADASWVRSDVVQEDENCSELPDRDEQVPLTRTARAGQSFPGWTPQPRVIATVAVPFDVRLLATVTTNALSVRTGPSLLYPRSGIRHLKGDRLLVIGRTSDAGWVQIRSGESGWVSARSIEITGNILSLPVVAVEDEPIEGEE